MHTHTHWLYFVYFVSSGTPALKVLPRNARLGFLWAEGSTTNRGTTYPVVWEYAAPLLMGRILFLEVPVASSRVKFKLLAC